MVLTVLIEIWRRSGGEQDYDKISLHGDEDVDILDGIEIISTVANDDGTVDENIFI